jgi:very-short-patch-repair endonuclease
MKQSEAENLYEALLKKYCLQYEKQFKIKGKKYDFKIGNTIIEIDGDFYHANPKYYPDGPIYQMQKSAVENDRKKNVIAIEEGYVLKRIWYSELKNYIKENREAELLPYMF